MDDTADFVDPRDQPHPFEFRAPSRMTSDPAQLVELYRLCREGRIYEIESWIRSGRPLVGPEQRRARGQQNALKIAISTRQHDLALLLLCNGFSPDPGDESLLEFALREKRRDYAELLLAWGADPQKVDPLSVLETYDSVLFERFWNLGLDLTADLSLAYTLAAESSNRPAYGWARRHRDDPRVARALALALTEAVGEGRDRAVALLLWAGADPHVRVPNLRWYQQTVGEPDEYESAVMSAVTSGQGRFLAKLKLDRQLDDFEWLWANVADPDAVDALARVALPTDWSEGIIRNLSRLGWGLGDTRRERGCLERMVEGHAARLTQVSDDELRRLRRMMLRNLSDPDMMWILRWMSRIEHCEPTVYRAFIDSAALRRKYGGRGVQGLPGARRHSSRSTRG